MILLITAQVWAQEPKDVELEGVYRLSGSDVHLPNQELVPYLKNLIEDHTVLALGESVHGSANVIKMQQRLVQTAVTELGVRHIFLESKLLATQKLNDYLQTCEGDLPSILRSSRFGAIEDEIMLFDWICTFNQAHQNDPVQVWGVDIYHFSTIDHQFILSGIKPSKHKDLLKQKFQQMEGVCVGHGKSRKQYMAEIYAYYEKRDIMSLSNYRHCDKLLTQVLNMLSSPGLPEQHSMHHVNSRIYIRNLQAMQWYWLNRFSLDGDPARLWQYRDQAMAENLTDFWNALNQPKSIWMAHTSHVSKQAAQYIKPLDLEKQKPLNIKPAGVYLSQTLNEHYKVIGFTGYDIDGMQGDFLVATDEKSLDLYLKNKVNLPYLWIDLTATGPLFDQFWWMQHENGGSHAFDNGVWMNPVDQYDALIYIERSNASTVIPQQSFLPKRTLEIPRVMD